jgi:hypothetical protein
MGLGNPRGNSADENGLRRPASITKVMTLYLLFEQLTAATPSLNRGERVETVMIGRRPTEFEDEVKSKHDGAGVNFCRCFVRQAWGRTSCPEAHPIELAGLWTRWFVLASQLPF